MTRIYVSENGSDKMMDLEINVDSALAQKRLMAEMQKPKKNRKSA